MSGRAGSHIPTPRALRRRLLAWLVVCAALLTTGCLNDLDVAPGDVFTVEETFEFYFKAGPHEHINFPPRLAPYLLDAASWQVPDGVSLEKSDLRVLPTPVSWSDGNYTHTASGFTLRASCVLRVAQDIRPGDRQLLLSLPGLTRVGSILKAEPTFPANPTPPAWGGALNVKSFVVHGTAAKNFFWVARRVLGGVLVLAFLVLLIAGSVFADS